MAATTIARQIQKQDGRWGLSPRGPNVKNLLSSALIAAFMFLGWSTSAPCQDIPEDTAPVMSRSVVPVPVQVLPPSEEIAQFSKVMYVLDVSGSMKSILPLAIRATDVFTSDGFQAAVITFTNSHARWGGVDEPCKHPPDERCGHNCLPAGWCWMPKHRDVLLGYLSSFPGHGNTDPSSAITAAYRDAPDNCLIVFISDGAFNGAGPATAATEGAEARKKEGKPPVQMLVWGTDIDACGKDSLVHLAKIGRGGLWRAEQQEDHEEPAAQTPGYDPLLDPPGIELIPR